MAVTIQLVGVGFIVGVAVAVTLITFGVDVGGNMRIARSPVNLAVGGLGVGVGTGVAVGMAVGGVVSFNLTATVWLESICI